MNTYNENLHSSVVASLQSLELDQKNMNSKLDASIFTLYFAEGARITAEEKLDASRIKYDFQKKVKDQAVINGNISFNLAASATQQKTYTAQAVTNSAVAASNVQIAANAIVRLASDIASVYSIVNAADFDGEIYVQTKEAYSLINETAYDAEKASQIAMDASTLMAEVSSSTVSDEAKLTNTSMTNLLSIANADFNAISATLASDNSARALASVAEKKAEGVLEFINAEYFSTKSAYQLNNKELNLNLCVPEKLLTSDTYTVTFDFYHSPFTYDQTNLKNKPEHATSKNKNISTLFKSKNNADSVEKVPGYPVKEYYIMLVKDSMKSTFSISNAENLLLNSDQCLKISGAPTLLGQKEISEVIYVSQLLDSDGEKMELGVQYAVFVLAVFTEEYKKGINNFDDYLSAPSAAFKLTNKLQSPKPGKENIYVPKVEPNQYQHLEFHLNENKDFKVEYRCIFLPDNKDLIAGLLSESGLRTIEKEVEKLESIADKYDPKIISWQAKIISLESDIEALDALIKEATDKKKHAATDKEKQKAQDEIDKLKSSLGKTQKELEEDKKELTKNKKQKNIEMKAIEPSKPTQPGFFFNLKLAEQVSAANYKVAIVHHAPNKETGTDAIKGHVVIDENVTDNFGNPLIDGKNYVPVILSSSKALEENLKQFTNSLSNYESTQGFSYKAKNK